MPIDDQIKCAERELKMRLSVYPGRVINGRMTQDKASHEIAAMKAIIETLKTIKGKQEELCLE